MNHSFLALGGRLHSAGAQRLLRTAGMPSSMPTAAKHCGRLSASFHALRARPSCFPGVIPYLRSQARVPMRWSARKLSQSAREAAQQDMEYKGLLGMENSHALYGIMAANVAGFVAWHARYVRGTWFASWSSS